ncbi:AAC(3) family N-acetyltransferase [Arenibaculum pallidiluteum]|uniref:AAC(3) family N-acetyltransferase n=1 Tax=Arenibaculum pallidiluteum TaxID=2812559 RepID=UPI001A9695E2|nr:AAC(3) family N-acetyltransferase [Arenibaculum pallidiluteum]
MITSSDIARDLVGMGVRAGDTLYVRSKASAVGRMAPPAGQTLVAGLLEAVGPEGTIVVPAFTDPGFRWSRNKARFTPDQPPNTGVLSKIVLKQAGAFRSAHPTHSFAAIGPRAREILGDHDASKPAFHPMGRLIDLDASMILLGCATDSPGFSTVHFVQNELGLSSRHWTRFLYEVEVPGADGTTRWHPSEDPGCSRGFDKMYRHYIARENFTTGHVGAAYTILVRARGAYQCERDVLSRDPCALLCDRADCVSCRILRAYNLGAIPAALTRRVWRSMAGRPVRRADA